MFIEVNDMFIDEMKYLAQKLRTVSFDDTDIMSAYTILETIIESAEEGPEVRSKVINREGHTHVLLTSFCLSNEWLGDKK